MAEKHQPYGPSFNRDMEAIIAAIQTAPNLFNEADIRANFRKAGIEFVDPKVPEIQAPEPMITQYEEDPEDVGLND